MKKWLSYLKFGDLNADVKELTVGLEVGVVTSGDLVLAAEARVRNGVGREVRRTNLTQDRGRRGGEQDHQNTCAYKKLKTVQYIADYNTVCD